MTLTCPYCKNSLNIPEVVTSDHLIKCGVCGKISELLRGIQGYSLVKAKKVKL